MGDVDGCRLGVTRINPQREKKKRTMQSETKRKRDEAEKAEKTAVARYLGRHVLVGST